MEEWGFGQNSACADQILGLGGHVEGVEVVGGDAAGAAVGGQASKRTNEDVFVVGGSANDGWVEVSKKTKAKGMRRTRYKFMVNITPQKQTYKWARRMDGWMYVCGTLGVMVEESEAPFDLFGQLNVQRSP